jgi:hypothetical protein
MSKTFNFIGGVIVKGGGIISADDNRGMTHRWRGDRGRFYLPMFMTMEREFQIERIIRHGVNTISGG